MKVWMPDLLKEILKLLLITPDLKISKRTSSFQAALIPYIDIRVLGSIADSGGQLGYARHQSLILFRNPRVSDAYLILYTEIGI